MWIRLHFAYNGKEVFVNTDKIVAINRDNTGTLIALGGDEENYITVKELPSDIFKLMQQDVSAFVDGHLKLTHNKG